MRAPHRESGHRREKRNTYFDAVPATTEAGSDDCVA
jgi:hypothetical protein